MGLAMSAPDPRYIAALIVAGMLGLAVVSDDTSPAMDRSPPTDTGCVYSTADRCDQPEPECPDGIEWTDWCGCEPPVYGDDC
jgi:hypothetical protein